jgi:hypothetical protein
MVDNVLSISLSDASGITDSGFEPYGVIRYDDRADRSPPSFRGAGLGGAAPRSGIIDTPPRKSSIWSIRVGRSECTKRFWNISKI